MWTVSLDGMVPRFWSPDPTERFGPRPCTAGRHLAPDLRYAGGYLNPRQDGRPVHARRVRAGHQHLLSTHVARIERRGGALPRRWVPRVPRVHRHRAEYEGLRSLPAAPRSRPRDGRVAGGGLPHGADLPALARQGVAAR